MILVDTSIWVDLFRDPTGNVRDALELVTSDEEVVLTRFNQLELLQGARDEQEWTVLSVYLEHQDYLETEPETWRNAARIYFDLRRRGQTVRNTVDCCIAELAYQHDALLVHRDRDFAAIADVRPIRHRWFGEVPGGAAVAGTCSRIAHAGPAVGRMAPHTRLGLRIASSGNVGGDTTAEWRRGWPSSSTLRRSRRIPRAISSTSGTGRRLSRRLWRRKTAAS